MAGDDIIRDLMKESIEEAKKSVSEDQGIHPLVGAIIADQDGNILQRAHRGEVSGCHAEYLCIKKAKEKGQDLSNCMIFATLEPCTARGPGKISCSKHIIESGIGKVYIGMLDPNPAICGRGETRLRFNIQVERFPSDLIKALEEFNGDFIGLHKESHLTEESLYVKVRISDLMRDYVARKGIPIKDDLPVNVNMTIEDIVSICESICLKHDIKNVDIYQIVEDARAVAYDKKYAERTYDDDGRGIGDYWEKSVRNIFTGMGADDYHKKKMIVVGIGNGLEGKTLYKNCEQLTVVDIGKKSLEYAEKILPKCQLIVSPAENLDQIQSGSQDIYISLRTYQSSYFDRGSSIREAYRVVRQGGIVIISVANGFLDQGSIIPGLLIPGTQIVDQDLGFKIADQIRSKMSLLNFEEIGMCTNLDEIYVFGRRGR
jgi:pyrimidine deaminase RibD-like protein/SAM-dependent methyltransferase